MPLKSTLSLYIRTITACLGAFVCGFTVSELGIVYNHLAVDYKIFKDNDESRNICTLVVGILSLSAMISAYFSSYIINIMGRRKLMILADSIFIFGTLLGMVQDKYAFAIARFIMGIGVGLNTSVILLYIKEISPDEYCRKTCSVFNAMLNLGVIFGFLISLPLKKIDLNKEESDNYWRVVILFPAAVCIVRSLLYLFVYRLDTPFYYYSNNRTKAGRIAIQDLYTEDSVQSVEDELTGANSQPNQRSESTYDTVLKGQSHSTSYYVRFFVGMSLNFFQQMTGITMIMAYSTSVFGDIVKESSNQKLLVLLGYIFLSVVSFAGCFLSGSLQRKLFLQVGYASCFVLLLILGLLSTQTIKGNQGLQGTAITIIFLFYLIYNLTIGPITGIVTSEIVKNEAMTYSTLMNWIGNVISLALNFNQYLWINYLIFSGFCLFALVNITKWVKETKNLSFKEIQKLYQGEIESDEIQLQQQSMTSALSEKENKM